MIVPEILTKINGREFDCFTIGRQTPFARRSRELVQTRRKYVRVGFGRQFASLECSRHWSRRHCFHIGSEQMWHYSMGPWSWRLSTYVAAQSHRWEQWCRGCVLDSQRLWHKQSTTRWSQRRNAWRSQRRNDTASFSVHLGPRKSCCCSSRTFMSIERSSKFFLELFKV